jgi:glutaconyl-CoA/methylmalonyl-CoA decarboxylase subunit gamma
MPKHLRITVEGRVYDVIVEDVTEDAGSTFYQTSSVGMPATPAPAAPMPPTVPAPAGAVSENDKLAPLGGAIIEINVKVGDNVKAGQQVLVLEAMKMKTVIVAHKDGTVTHLPVKVGDLVDAGQVLLTVS